MLCFGIVSLEDPFPTPCSTCQCLFIINTIDLSYTALFSAVKQAIINTIDLSYTVLFSAVKQAIINTIDLSYTVLFSAVKQTRCASHGFCACRVLYMFFGCCFLHYYPGLL